ncbi:MAG: hypothetical protein ABI867_10870 [Kofleriaceae bacterium]
MSVPRCAMGVIAVALVACPALVSAEAEEIGLVYIAPKECPTAAEFFERVAERSSARLVGAARERTFEVAIVRTDTGMHGSLAIRTARGVSTREVGGVSCDETVSALVIVAALAIVETSPPLAPVVTLSAPTTSARRWIVVGAGLARHRGVVPDWVYSIPVYVSLGRPNGVRVRVGMARSEQQQRVMAVGDTAFRWTTGRMDVSPLAVVRGRFDASPSLGLEAGVLEGRGTNIGMPARDARLWLAPDLALRARVLLDRFAVELEGTVAAPLIRDRFFIAPDTTVHEVPRLTFALGISLAMRLW